MDTRVLLVEDDITARMLLADVLSSAGYDVLTAADGDAAIHVLAEQSFDVVLTDIRMGSVDGIQVLADAKRRPRPPAVILLTGYGSLETAIAALRSGADNYLLKPCEPTDLLACIADAARRRAELLRQTDAITSITRSIEQLRGLSPASEHTAAVPAGSELLIRIGRLVIDSFFHTATFDQQPLHLTPIEYALLRCLAEARGRVLSYSEIVRRTHGHITNDNDAQLLIKAHIRNLRRKIDPAYLVNVRGTGYRLAAPE
jgi:DNA-binding response OmpR family regulator